MGAKKIYLSLSERKFHILTAFKLYQCEMYLAQKATEKKNYVKDDVTIEVKCVDFLQDYQTQKSLSVLFETTAVFEPDLYNKLKSKSIEDGVADIIEYLTGQQVKAENIGQEKPKPAKSDADGAIIAADLIDKKKIIPAKTIPKNAGRKK